MSSRARRAASVENSAVDARRSDRTCGKTCFGEHGTILGGTVRATFGQREQRRGIERDRQRAIERVIEKYIVDQQSPAVAQRLFATANERLALGHVPIVQNVREQYEVHVRR